MAILNFKIEGQKLLKDCPSTIVDGTIRYFDVSVEASPDWDGMTIYVHFVSGDQAYEAVCDHAGYIGADAHIDLPDGRWEVFAHGINADGTKRITTSSVGLIVQTGRFNPTIPSLLRM